MWEGVEEGRALPSGISLMQHIDCLRTRQVHLDKQATTVYPMTRALEAPFPPSSTLCSRCSVSPWRPGVAATLPTHPPTPPRTSQRDVWGLAFGDVRLLVWRLEIREWCLVFGVWCFEEWGFEFRVSGLGVLSCGSMASGHLVRIRPDLARPP